MSETQRKAFITGVTGEIGGQALELLCEANMPVRLMCRRQKQVDHYVSRGIDTVLCNLDDNPADLALHMKGCDRLYLNTAGTPDQLQHNVNAIDAGVIAKVKWIIKISAGDARHESSVPWVRAHASADDYLREVAGRHGIYWTIISPSGFMQNFISEAPAIQKGLLPHTAGNGRCGWVDTKDVAAVVSQVIQDTPEQHHRQNYILTGPKLITLPEITDAFTRQAGHRVRYVHLPGPVFGALLRFSGADAWLAKGLVAQFVEIIRPNKEGVEVSDSIEKLTGKPATSIDEFVARNKDKFEGFDVLPYISGASVISAVFAARFLFKWRYT